MVRTARAKPEVIQPLPMPETPPKSPDSSENLPSIPPDTAVIAAPPARVKDDTTTASHSESTVPEKVPDIGAAIELHVAFGNANIGDKTGSIGIVIDRSEFSILQADEYLCGHRVGATIIGRPLGNDADQGNLPILADDVALSSTFDVKAFRVTRKTIGCSLVVNLADVDVKTLTTFAKRNGKFIITNVGELPKNAAKAPKPESEPEDEDDDEFESPE